MIDTTQIKQKLSCVDYLAQQGIHLRPGGRCVSPLRPGAKNPSSFYCTDDHWYDFGSASGGDVIDLAAQLQYGGDVGAAIRALAKQLGLTTNNQHTSQWRSEIQHLCNRTAAYHAALTPDDYKYLAGRGLSNDDISRLMIGRVTDGYLKGRLFLPYFKNGAVVYYATRTLPDGAFPDNKYMKASSTESPAYEHVPWGLQTLDRQSDTLIISEGYFDAVSWEIQGFPVISPITGDFSRDQWPTVLATCRMFKRVLIVFDNDQVSRAGERFTQRAAKRLLKHRIPFVVAKTPDGIKDINDYYTQGGSLQHLVDTAVNGLQYIAAQYTDAVELQRFILSISRHTDATEITSALFQPTLTERFNTAILKDIKKRSESPPTESQIADEITAKHTLIYIDQVGFYEWNGKIWQRTNDITIISYADIQYGKRFATYHRAAAVYNLLKARTVSEVAFDRNPVLTFQNGTLEIETGRFRDFSQADYCSIIMDYPYEPEATCPAWRAFIEDVTEGEPRKMEILQFIAGYVLFPDCRHQKAFILIGEGSNGKSVYIDVIQRLYGLKNVTHVEPTGFTSEFQRMILKDSLLNVGSDIKSDFGNSEIREWFIKLSDGAFIQACYKGKTHVHFQPRCKFVYACNVVPTVEIIKGLERRFQFIKFTCKYVDDPDPKKPMERKKDIDLTGKLLAELPGIFNWAYEGYQMLLTVNYFTDAPEQEELIKQFREVSNPIIVFCEDYEDEFQGSVSRDDIYAWYVEWCAKTGRKHLSREKFLPRFRGVMMDKICSEQSIRKSNRRERVFVFEPVPPVCQDLL